MSHLDKTADCDSHGFGLLIMIRTIMIARSNFVFSRTTKLLTSLSSNPCHAIRALAHALSQQHLENHLLLPAFSSPAATPVSGVDGSECASEGKPEFEDFGKFVENSPIEEVALTVPITDDPTMPVWTFRMWTLGILWCAVLAFVNQFFFFRTAPLSISALTAQVSKRAGM